MTGQQSAAELAESTRALLLRIADLAEQAAREAREAAGAPVPRTAVAAGRMGSIHRAIHDPGSVVPRLGLDRGGDVEPLAQWQTRAVIAVVAPYLDGDGGR